NFLPKVLLYPRRFHKEAGKKQTAWLHRQEKHADPRVVQLVRLANPAESVNRFCQIAQSARAIAVATLPRAELPFLYATLCLSRQNQDAARASSLISSSASLKPFEVSEEP